MTFIYSVIKTEVKKLYLATLGKDDVFKTELFGKYVLDLHSYIANGNLAVINETEQIYV